MERDWGRDMPAKATEVGWDGCRRSRGRTLGRRGKGSKAGGGATGENGEDPDTKAGSERSVYKNMPYPNGTVAEENPTRKRASSAPRRVEGKGEQ